MASKFLILWLKDFRFARMDRSSILAMGIALTTGLVMILVEDVLLSNNGVHTFGDVAVRNHVAPSSDISQALSLSASDAQQHKEEKVGKSKKEALADAGKAVNCDLKKAKYSYLGGQRYQLDRYRHLLNLNEYATLKEKLDLLYLLKHWELKLRTVQEGAEREAWKSKLESVRLDEDKFNLLTIEQRKWLEELIEAHSIQ